MKIRVDQLRSRFQSLGEHPEAKGMEPRRQQFRSDIDVFNPVCADRFGQKSGFDGERPVGGQKNVRLSGDGLTSGNTDASVRNIEARNRWSSGPM